MEHGRNRQKPQPGAEGSRVAHKKPQIQRLSGAVECREKNRAEMMCPGGKLSLARINTKTNSNMGSKGFICLTEQSTIYHCGKSGQGPKQRP